MGFVSFIFELRMIQIRFYGLVLLPNFQVTLQSSLKTLRVSSLIFNLSIIREFLHVTAKYVHMKRGYNMKLNFWADWTKKGRKSIQFHVYYPGDTFTPTFEKGNYISHCRNVSQRRFTRIIRATVQRATACRDNSSTERFILEKPASNACNRRLEAYRRHTVRSFKSPRGDSVRINRVNSRTNT